MMLVLFIQRVMLFIVYSSAKHKKKFISFKIWENLNVLILGQMNEVKTFKFWQIWKLVFVPGLYLFL